MQNKLLPCPFCGGEAILDREDIFCDNCHLSMRICDRYLTREAETYAEAKQQTIEAWNTRKPMGDVASKVQQVIWDSCSGDEYKYASKEIEKIFNEVYVEGGVDNAE